MFQALTILPPHDRFTGLYFQAHTNPFSSARLFSHLYKTRGGGGQASSLRALLD